LEVLLTFGTLGSHHDETPMLESRGNKRDVPDELPGIIGMNAFGFSGGLDLVTGLQDEGGQTGSVGYEQRVC
jgi:hypothetical protein